MQTPAEFSDQAHSWVTEAVNRRRIASGLARAIHDVSRLFGIKPRRIEQFLRGQVRNPYAWEYAQMEARRHDELRAYLARMDHEAAILRVRLGE